MFFIKSGILSTIQDLGRFCLQSKGVNPNGVMDTYSFKILNILLGNDESEAALEIHFPAPAIRFEEEGVLAICGANFSPTLNSKPIKNWTSYNFKKDDILEFSKKISGERCYVGFSGGFDISGVFGSKSTNILSNFGGKLIEPLTRLTLNQNSFFKQHHSLSRHLQLPKQNSSSIRFTTSKEYGLLDEFSKNVLENSKFNITNNSNRMAYLLEGEAIKVSKKIELLSSAVSFGTMQLLPNGQLVILMADHQTTGGYPRIGNIAKVDLPKLAQMPLRSFINFKQLSIEEAENLIIEEDKLFERLKLSIELHEKN